MAASSISCGVGRSSPNGMGEGAMVRQPPSWPCNARPPRHGESLLALRPACASWMAGTAPWLRMNCAMRAWAGTWASDQMPRSPGVILPTASTAVASAITRPAPPAARDPRCTRCQSSGMPSTAEYWHIGDTPILFLTSMPRSLMGSKSPAILVLRRHRQSPLGDWSGRPMMAGYGWALIAPKTRWRCPEPFRAAAIGASHCAEGLASGRPSGFAAPERAYRAAAAASCQHASGPEEPRPGMGTIMAPTPGSIG